MNFAKNIVIASVIFASLGLVGTAHAADVKLSDCVQVAKQASTALEAAQPGQNTDQARELVRSARTYCANSMFDRGVKLYGKALELLDAKK